MSLEQKLALQLGGNQSPADGDQGAQGAQGAAADNGAQGDAGAAAPQGGEGEGSQGNGGQAAPQVPANGGVPEGYINLNELGFQSLDDLKNKLQTADRFENEGNLKFPSERAKSIYEYAIRTEGMEFDRAKEFLEIASMNVEELDEREARYLAFRNEARYASLTEEEKRAMFDEEEEQKYGTDPEQMSVAARARQKTETLEARSKLKSIQAEFNKAPETQQLTPEEISNIRTTVKNTVVSSLAEVQNTFKVQLSGKNEAGQELKGELNLQLRPEQIAKLGDIAFDPGHFYSKLQEEAGVVKDGQIVDPVGYAQLLSKIAMFDEYVSLAYAQGMNDQMLQIVNQGPAGSKPKGPADTNSYLKQVGDAAAGLVKNR